MEYDAAVDYTIVFLIGVAVGAGEILTRHRGQSFQALLNKPATIYCLLQGAISVGVLTAIHSFDWTFGVEGENSSRWAQVSAAGFGAMTVLRSSLIVAKEQGTNRDIGFGPAGLLQIVLSRLDNLIASRRTSGVSRQARRLMAGVDFDKAELLLPVQCIFAQKATVGQVTAEEQLREIGVEIGTWTKYQLPPETKCLNLGVYLIDEFGQEVVAMAVEQLGPSIMQETLPAPPSS